ncbi:hypothetical protein ACGIF2_05610 [Cellulomonas sp. P22]|uniref:hypothetical protein n=1 Tax=Cellulomonas sp. P22 TaxID=3373189 RepID=UPI0037B4620A
MTGSGEVRHAEMVVPGCVANVQLAGRIDGMAYVVGPLWVWDAQIEYLVTVYEPPGSPVPAHEVQMLTRAGDDTEHGVVVVARQPGLTFGTPVHEPHALHGTSTSPTRAAWVLRLAPAQADHDLVVSIRGSGQIIEVTVGADELAAAQARQIRLWDTLAPAGMPPVGT